MAINLNVQGNTQPLEAAVQAAVNRIRRQPIKITIDDKGATQPLGNMKRSADEFTKSMEAANARILAFGASMAIINGVANAFKGMVKNLVEVEKAMADVNVVMGLSAQNLDKFSDGLFKVAKETGAAFKVAADAATEYARQGLGVEESLKRTRDALVLTRLTGMDSAEAVKSLTAAMNTYGTQIKDTTQLVSKFAAVDVKFAVSAQDFADAISRTGQSAQSAGVSIDELVGIVTAAQQKTARGGAVIGNALKTIFTKTGKTDTLNQLENLGIAVRDLEGNTIGAQRILNDLANTFDTLSAAQKAQITQTMGGLFHINILKAVLSDAAKQNGIMAEATKISAGATDEAIQKNEELRKTMSAVATETGLAIKQVSSQIGEIALAPGMEKILNTVKSLAEGLSGVLGDGETTGNSFATGFLKGIGNIITGPGLVVLTGVFFKLFGQALKFTKESLTSLVGVTTEKQKQKAIQTSLVTLFGQNAALGKEMLRTDISRTEKEKIILGLLKAQVVEANLLNTVAKSSASNLYRQGYGANLAPRKGRAGGHIPNFADPERAQAARGGYAAGTIRSMNMPGEGSVIYNSAEKVKNFKGMSQPAIMPPHSSKAGKNYQQAFGDVHGFDPYAAGGYIPNFAQTYNADSKMVLFSGSARDGGGYTGSDRKKNIIYINPSAKSGDKKFSATKKTGMKAVNVPYFTIGKDDKEREANDPKIKNKIQGDLIKQAQKTSNQLVNSLFKMPSIPSVITSSDVAVASGKIFEKIIMSVQKGVAKEAYGAEPPGNALLDIPRPGRDALWDLFGAGPLGSLGAEAKIALGSGGDAAHLKSAAEKFYKIDSLGKPEDMALKRAKAFAPAGKLNLSLTSDLAGSTKVQNELGAPTVRKAYSKFGKLSDAGKFDLLSRYKSYGHIPNFADPLSDAIGREKAAGVPVSQIRVGSHGALMGKGNPLGLGVTNTHDEPNGLRDVFGANGFVPNYVDPVRISGSDFNSPFSSVMGDQVKRFNKIMARFTSQFKQGEINFKELQARTQRLGSKMNLHSSSIESLVSKQSTSIGAIDKLNAQRRKYQNMLSRANSKFSNGAIGKGLSGVGGMGLMMGAPMLAGFLQEDGAAKGGASYNVGGALQGAGSGAAMGMIFGPIGVAAGGLIGAFGGLIGALDDTKKALEQEKAARLDVQTQSIAQGFASIAQPDELSGKIGGTKANPSDLKKLGLSSEASVLEGFLKTSEIFKGARSEAPMLYSLTGEQRKSLSPEVQAYMKKVQMGKAEYYTEDQVREGGVFSAIHNQDRQIRLSKQYQSQSKAARGFGEQEVKSSKQIQGSLVDYLMQNEKSRLFGFNFGKQSGDEEDTVIGNLTREEYTKVLKGQSIERDGKTLRADTSKIEQELGPKLQRIDSDYLTTKEQQNEAIILQLDIQKIMLESQKRAKQAQFNISASMQNQASNLSLMEKTMGGFATEQQKAQFKYIGSINKAAETYASSAQQAENAFESNMLGVLEDDDVKSKVKTALAKRIKQRGGGDVDVNKLEVSDEFLKLSQKERQEMYTELNLGDEITKNIENQVTARENALSLAEKQVNQSNSIAQNEFKINDAIAKRKDLISDMKTSAGIGAETVGSAGKIRAMDAQVGAAERLGAVGPGYQTSADQEAFQMQEKRIALQNKSLEIQEQADKKMNDELIKLADLKMQEAELVELKSFVGPEKKEDAEKRLRDIAALEATGEERKKQQEEILGSVKRINKEAKKEVSTAEKLLALEEKRLAEKRAHETGPGAFGNGMSDTAKSMREQVEYMDYELGKRIPTAFADGLAGAMTEAINGTKSIKEGLMDAAVGFLGMIQQAMMQKMAYQMVGAMGFSKGGNVRKYSKGGGVPAMVSNGEYVMGRDAVNKYGGSFMHGMNAGGRIPGFASGGSVENDLLSKGKIRREGAPGGPAAQGSALASNFGGGRGFDSGRLYQRRAMSGAFYAQSGNVGLGEDTSAIQSILSEEERIRQEAEAKRQAKKAKRRQLLGMVASIGLMYGLGQMNLFGPKGPPPGSGGIIPGTEGSLRIGNSLGGPIRKYASGGHISGKSGIDQIPAMLSEGEYVIRASSARQIGKPMLDQINAGKFYDGGAVSEIAGSSETGSTGGNTNNINISINMERGSSNQKQQKESDSSGVNPADASSDEKNNSELAERIKQQVVSVIMEEQRPGGLLTN